MLIIEEILYQELIYSRGLKFAHQNIRGLHCNFDLLQEFVYNHRKIDILCLSESHITDFQQQNLVAYDLDGYKLLSSNKWKRRRSCCLYK